MIRDELEQRLVDEGIKPTPQRLDVAELILPSPCHMSADQIIVALREGGARVSKATVYNTLNLFCERGLLRRVDVDPARQYYDSTHRPHHHFYNVDTGELTDIPLEAVKLSVGAPLPDGTYQDGAEVVIRVRSAGRSAA
jgi:Fur family transcriptional regulator, iron response regulator